VLRRRFDVMAFVAGLFFLGVAAIWGFGGQTLSFDNGYSPSRGASWALLGLPALLVAVGVVGLVTSLVLTAKRRREDT
jgi:hypothetical protein